MSENTLHHTPKTSKAHRRVPCSAPFKCALKRARVADRSIRSDMIVSSLKTNSSMAGVSELRSHSSRGILKPVLRRACRSGGRSRVANGLSRLFRRPPGNPTD